MTQPQLSVLIVNWRSKEFLRRCLETIRLECKEVVIQIVVVDGGSFDGCGEMLSQSFPEVEFVQSAENVGFGMANNLGFQRVTGETMLLLNPDTEIKPGAVRHLLKVLQSRPDAGILGPRLLNTDGSLQTSCVQSSPSPWNQALDSEFLRRLFPNSPLWGVGRAFNSAEPVEVEAVSGACMMIRSTVFHRVGGFTPDFVMYGEDMDLCAKVRKLNLKNCYVPRAEVVHHGGGSSRSQASVFSTVMMRSSLQTYMRLHYGRVSALWYRALQGLSAVTRLGLLIPACLVFRGSAGKSARQSVVKWWTVFRWASGNLRPCL